MVDVEICFKNSVLSTCIYVVSFLMFVLFYFTLVYIIIKARVIKVIDVHVNGYLNQLVYKYIFLVFLFLFFVFCFFCFEATSNS